MQYDSEDDCFICAQEGQIVNQVQWSFREKRPRMEKDTPDIFLCKFIEYTNFF